MSRSSSGSRWVNDWVQGQENAFRRRSVAMAMAADQAGKLAVPPRKTYNSLPPYPRSLVLALNATLLGCPFIKDIRKIFGILYPLPPCQHFDLIYSTKITQPPLLSLLLDQPHSHLSADVLNEWTMGGSFINDNCVQIALGILEKRCQCHKSADLPKL